MAKVVLVIDKSSSREMVRRVRKLLEDEGYETLIFDWPPTEFSAWRRIVASLRARGAEFVLYLQGAGQDAGDAPTKVFGTALIRIRPARPVTRRSSSDEGEILVESRGILNKENAAARDKTRSTAFKRYTLARSPTDGNVPLEEFITIVRAYARLEREVRSKSSWIYKLSRLPLGWTLFLLAPFVIVAVLGLVSGTISFNLLVAGILAAGIINLFRTVGSGA